MILKFKKLHPSAVLPAHAKPGDAGLDLTVTEGGFDNENGQYFYKFGLAIEIPEGYVGLLFPRSSIYKKHQTLNNSVGVIDSSYRGEIAARFDSRFPNKLVYQVGERAVQLVVMPYQVCTTEWAEELSDTERAGGGFGSTGA